MQVHVQMQLYELWGPPNPWLAPEQRSQPLTAAVVYYSIVHACSTDGTISFSPFRQDTVTNPKTLDVQGIPATLIGLSDAITLRVAVRGDQATPAVHLACIVAVDFCLLPGSLVTSSVVGWLAGQSKWVQHKADTVST